ncbi:MAG: cell division protein ZapA [Candidatus Schekmanbacteria bacterium]|nr:cell division protein ZapA [Candidatus Schekmanbacteria bacterium]
MHYSEVEIYGQKFTIKSDLEEAYLDALVKYVDDKIKEISTSTGVVSTSKVALLAALNIAEELFQIRGQKDNIENLVSEKSSHLLAIIEKCKITGTP